MRYDRALKIHCCRQVLVPVPLPFEDAAVSLILAALLGAGLLRLLTWAWRYNRRQQARRRWQAAYADYMTSDLWKALRCQALERDGHRCRLCNARRRLEVHHRYYPEVMGTETLDALTTLCHDCHENVTLALRTRR